MNGNTWRHLASGLLAATLSLGIAACDDDTSSKTDMGVGADMSAEVDMTAPSTLGTGQLVLADLVGTAFSGTTVAPRTHTLLALPSLPKFSGNSDPSSDLNLTGFSGCTINRYTPSNLPGGDGDAGTVTFTGWNYMTTIGLNAKTGSEQVNSAVNSPITCQRDATTMTYSCVYGGTVNPDGGAMGASTNDVIYPVIPNRCVLLDPTTHMPTGTTCPTTGPLGWPAAFPCNPRYVPNPMDPVPGCTFPTTCATAIEVCEQSPIAPLGLAEITENVSGGSDYGAKMKTIGNGGGTDGGAGMFPGPLYIVSVASGGTDITAFGPDTLTGGNGLSFADGKIDPTKDLKITFSCDPNNPTKAAGCSSTTLAALLLQTSTATKELPAPVLPAGVGQCIAKPMTGEISVSAAQMTALFGGQTGGSIKLALANLGIALDSTNSHTLVFTAGMGIFGFTNQ